jgi:hypothetical protein
MTIDRRTYLAGCALTGQRAASHGDHPNLVAKWACDDADALIPLLDSTGPAPPVSASASHTALCAEVARIRAFLADLAMVLDDPTAATHNVILNARAMVHKELGS